MSALQLLQQHLRIAALCATGGAAVLLSCSLARTSSTYQQQLLSMADYNCQTRNYTEALKHYDNIVRAYPQSPEAKLALYNIGFININYANPKPDRTAAAAAFKSFITIYPNDSLTPSASSWLGIIAAYDSCETRYKDAVQKVRNLMQKGATISNDRDSLQQTIRTCTHEKDSLLNETATLNLKIKTLEKTILKIEKGR
jgi:tetratricopeptide (TPR) repeat protein